MIILEPVGGLCNRLRSIDSMISMCQKHERSLLVLWNKTPDLNCVLPDLIDLKNTGIKVWVCSSPLFKRVVNKALRNRSMLNSSFHELFEPEKNAYGGKSMIHTEEVFYEKIEPTLNGILSQKLPYYFSSGFRLSNLNADSYSYFSPNKELAKQIEDKTRNFKNTIGLHIRRTDSEFSIAVSSDDKFLKLIDTFLATDPAQQFFIASDDLDFKELLTKKYGDLIIYNEMDTVDRNDPRAIKFATLDLYCLAATNKIYGSYLSSFSYVAGAIGNTEVDILR